jgi:lipid-binding SYLF domain-containing protein
MVRWQMIGLFFGLAFGLATTAIAASPEDTIESARTVLKELVSTPGKGIPAKLLQEAHAVVIVPDVIKISFIGGVRRGHGVVLLRDKDGVWGSPQFITLTGGSVGWQLGAQSTDVLLVFRSERSVQNLLSGKFTIGADAAAAAGPVGRNVAAATDAQLKAEILSYSRSRGLFAGVSLDGSAIEIDQNSTSEFYGSRPGELPTQVPQSAVSLVKEVAGLTGGGTPAAQGEGGDAGTPEQLAALRAEVASSSVALQKLLQPEWQKYLALPPEIYTTTENPPVEAIDAIISNFQRVSSNRQYADLSTQPAFISTFDALQAYRAALAQAGSGQLQLPPPPR